MGYRARRLQPDGTTLVSRVPITNKWLMCRDFLLTPDVYCVSDGARRYGLASPSLWVGKVVAGAFTCLSIRDSFLSKYARPPRDGWGKVQSRSREGPVSMTPRAS